MTQTLLSLKPIFFSKPLSSLFFSLEVLIMYTNSKQVSFLRHSFILGLYWFHLQCWDGMVMAESIWLRQNDLLHRLSFTWPWVAYPVMKVCGFLVQMTAPHQADHCCLFTRSYHKNNIIWPFVLYCDFFLLQESHSNKQCNLRECLCLPQCTSWLIALTWRNSAPINL